MSQLRRNIEAKYRCEDLEEIRKRAEAFGARIKFYRHETRLE